MLDRAETQTSRHAMARHTTDPLRLPGAPRGQTLAARRWRDLTRGYHALVGPERAARPDVRAKLSLVVSLQLMLEGIEAQAARGELSDHNALVQGGQQLVKILDDLNLPPLPGEDEPQPAPGVGSYLNGRAAP